MTDAYRAGLYNAKTYQSDATYAKLKTGMLNWKADYTA